MRTNILLTTSAALALAGQAAAQDGAEEIDEIVVTGSPIRDSQAAAIARKFDAENVVDVISADTIGRFPDQNLADSLGRLPGLAIERDQGQARYINFRGAPRRYTAIAFDGVDVPGAENGRIPRFDSFPSVIVSAVEANKAITPAMPGEAVAGFINLQTFDPFRSDGLSFSVEGGLGRQELGDGDVERYNARLSWSNDRFGVVLFGSHNGRDQTTDNREFDVSLDGGFETVEFRSYLVERQDNAYGGRVELRPGGVLERAFVSSIYSEFIDDEQRNQFNFAFDASGEAAVFTGGQASDPETDPVRPGEVGIDPFIGVTRLLQDGRYQNSTFVNTIGADLALGAWSLDTRLSYVETENTTDLVLPFSTFSAVGGRFDFTDADNPQLFLTDLAGDDIGASEIGYFANLVLPVAGRLDIEAWQLKADATREGDLFGLDTTFAVGGKIDLREAEGTEIFFAQAPLPDGFNFADFDTGRPFPTDFDNTIGGTVYDSVGLVGALRGAGADFSLDVPPDLGIGIEEDIYAGYAMATTRTDWGSLVYGARLEATRFGASGRTATTRDTGLLDGDGDPITEDVVAGVEAENDYVHVLPSLHLNYDLAEDTKVRLGLSTGVSRPTYTEARASVAIDATAVAAGGLVTVTGGNPDLDAEFAWGPDLSFEWYFDEASLFSVAAFARFVDDVIYADTRRLDDVSGFDPSGAVEPGTAGIFTAFANGEDGRLYGVEANFVGSLGTVIDGPLGGFGLQANATVLESSFVIPALGDREERTLDLPGTSDVILGGSVFYEKYGLSARINYQYRDDWLDETESEGADVFWAEQERLDASVRYTLPETPLGATVTLFADANNLTDERDVRYTRTRATPNQIEGYGRRWLVGVRVDY